MAAFSPRRFGGRTELDIDPDQLVWILYARESEDSEGTGEQVENQMEDLRAEVAGIGGRVKREELENDTSAFKGARGAPARGPAARRHTCLRPAPLRRRLAAPGVGPKGDGLRPLPAVAGGGRRTCSAQAPPGPQHD